MFKVEGELGPYNETRDYTQRSYRRRLSDLRARLTFLWLLRL